MSKEQEIIEIFKHIYINTIKANLHITVQTIANTFQLPEKEVYQIYFSGQHTK